MKKSHAEKPAEAVQEEQIEPKAWADGIPVYCAHDEIVATRSLTPNPQNPNQHPAEQVKKLAKVIRGNGWRQPITVSTRSGMIVKGHGRLLAAQLEDLDAVPVDYQNYETEAAELADLWADNYIAELAETDNRLAASILASIQNAGADLELAGSSPEEYDAIVQAITGAAEEDEDDDAGDEEPDEEEQIEPPAEPVTQRGDVWILGDHRVMCGDCTNLEDRALLLNGATPEVLLTDPPYCSGGQKESAKSTGSIGTKHADGKQPMIANDILSTRGYQNLIAAALKGIPCLFSYIFTDWRMWVYLFDLVEAAGFGVKSMIVWDKGTPGMGIGWRSQHEILMFAGRATTHFDGHKGYGNVLSCSRSGNTLHPTQKPLELLDAVVDNMEWATGFYDPFGGSGTTLIACEDHGAQSFTMELTPAYTDVIVERWIRHTGRDYDVKCIRHGKELDRAAIAPLLDRATEGGDEE